MLIKVFHMVFHVLLFINECLCYFIRVLHGGLTASLIDAVSTAALFNTKTRKTGVSVNMSIS